MRMSRFAELSVEITTLRIVGAAIQPRVFNISAASSGAGT